MYESKISTLKAKIHAVQEAMGAKNKKIEALEDHTQANNAKNKRLKLALQIANERRSQAEATINQFLDQPMGTTFATLILDTSIERKIDLESKLKMEGLQKEILIVNFNKDKANFEAKIASTKQRLQELMKVELCLQNKLQKSLLKYFLSILKA